MANRLSDHVGYRAGTRCCCRTMRTGYGLICGALILGLLLIGTPADLFAGSPFYRLPPEKIDKAQLKKAESVAVDLLSRWKAGKFESLSDDFTMKMQRALSPKAQESAHRSLKELFGVFQGLSFVEAMGYVTMPGTTIYRFRADFSGTKAKPEIRVVMDENGRVSGFWVKHWRDKLQ